LINLRNGTLYEISRIYDKNYAQFNLPRQVQVDVIEDLIRLQNIDGFLQKNLERFEG